jgi:hypothetical protein
MSYTELDLAQQDLKEENHLLTIYKEKPYRGWYIYKLFTPVEDMPNKFFKDIVVRFRLPPALPIYNEAVRHFAIEERLVGIHRFLIGEDLQEKTKEMMKFDTINSYVKQLSEIEVNEFLNRMKDLVTFDCNMIPYIHVRRIVTENEKEVLDSETENIIKNYILKEPDYLGTLIKVLNKEITILTAKELSKNTIYNESMELAV